MKGMEVLTMSDPNNREWLMESRAQLEIATSSVAEVNLYDRVILDNGLVAQIVHIIDNGAMYVADIDSANGWPEDETIFVPPREIRVIVQCYARGNERGPQNRF